MSISRYVPPRVGVPLDRGMQRREPVQRNDSVQHSEAVQRRETMLRAIADGAKADESARKALRPGAGSSEYAALEYEARAIAAGTEPVLAAILADPAVSDVFVVAGNVWVDRGSGIENLGVSLGDENKVRALATRMAAACGRRLDDACPVVDGTLPGGVRLHAVLPPISRDGTLISLRSFGPSAVNFPQMCQQGSINKRMARLLEAMVDRRANILISGATGSGKTTLLAALLALVPHDQRIICIEEVAELRPDHPHVVSLQERTANIQGAGAVTLVDLVRAAMRMRPDRLVLGECRGAEVREVLTALNTGHDGGLATVHANSVEDVPARLIALGSLASMSPQAVSVQTIAALDAVIHMRRTAGKTPEYPGHRWVGQVGIFDLREGTLTCMSAIKIDADGSEHLGPGWESLCRRLGIDT
ncbi:TadA family conjugal transfer-associated ATPase [Schaalia suimastitidis]|uniref:TadA family conjugal transfer-associated ATPase n=1 Tax=Schaalia suimastitidis TaxID=121163 RepID=UPI001F0A408F|nr:TadA family conjugal transfer-associated ATPase [Schaalia suimastitidis]